MDSIKRQARVAGLIYVLMALVAPIGLLYVPTKVYVSGDATATIENLRVLESLVRVGIASELSSQIIFIFLVLALYRLFKPVDEMLAKQVVIFGALMSVPIMLVSVVHETVALILVSDADFLSTFEKPQLDSLAYLFLRMHSKGVTVASIFWGIWLFPFGMLVIRSGFIPRFLGYLLMVAGVAYLASAMATLTLPQYASVVGKIAMPMEMAELPIILWLAIWGARTRSNDIPAT